VPHGCKPYSRRHPEMAVAEERRQRQAQSLLQAALRLRLALRLLRASSPLNGSIVLLLSALLSSRAIYLCSEITRPAAFMPA
jgi:hypothetical protein